MIEIYLDNCATTAPLASVQVSMAEAMGYANPSSGHRAGRRARRALEESRQAVAGLLGASSSSEIVFTSGGTESIFQAFRGGAKGNKGGQRRVITTAVEHVASREAVQRFGRPDGQLVELPVDRAGNLAPELLEECLSASGPAFVSIMMVNNETGVCFPIRELGEICNRHGALFHVDAVQAVGKLAIDVQELDCQYMSISGHKFHGPKGVGALYVKSGAPIWALMGGHQEGGRRGGTENVPGIVGMGVAADHMQHECLNTCGDIAELRNRFEEEVLAGVPGSTVNGDRSNRICTVSNIAFPKKDAAVICELLSSKGVYASNGAACTTGGELSPVLLAMGMSDEHVNGSVRFSLGMETTTEEISIATERVVQTINDSLDAVGWAGRKELLDEC